MIPRYLLHIPCENSIIDCGGAATSAYKQDILAHGLVGKVLHATPKTQRLFQSRMLEPKPV